jgi:hypothetical protein
MSFGSVLQQPRYRPRDRISGREGDVFYIDLVANEDPASRDGAAAEESQRKRRGQSRNIFRNLARSARHQKWKGCGFLRTSAELANLPGHRAIKIGAAHKKKFEEWLRLRKYGARDINGTRPAS